MKGKTTYSPEFKRLIDLLQHAAEPSNAVAQFNLAKIFLKCENKEMQKKAFSTFKRIANQNYTTVQTDAQFMLALCYENGRGVTKSYPRAIRWYKIAEDNISNDLAKNPDPVWDKAYKEFKETLEDFPDIDEALDNFFCEDSPEELNCITESAEFGDVDSQVYMMKLYEFGGGEDDKNEYAYWAEKAAENGNIEAMEELGKMFYYGKVLKQDYKSALYWLEKAASQGAEFSCCLLGKYYEAQKQYKEAAKWYRLYAKRSIKSRNKRLGWENGQSPTTRS
jgi:hypothetical protein